MPNEISEQETSIVTARTPLESFPVASLFFTHGEKAGQEIPLITETFFIGRSKNNNLALSDKSVSRKHAVINFIEGQYILSDLNSLKGCYVNGKKIEEVELKPGDIINVGENRMQFRLVTPSGTWIAPGKNRFKYAFLLVLLLIGLSIGGAWFFSQKLSTDRIPEDVLAKIELHYDKGINFFNKDHNVKAAREEWKSIVELDPDLKTPYAAKASKLLKNTSFAEDKEAEKETEEKDKK